MKAQCALGFGLGAALIALAAASGPPPPAGAGYGYAAAVGGAVVEAPRHFRALLPSVPANVVEIVQTAQQLGYWIRIQTDGNVTYLRGTTPCSACDPAQEAAFFAPPWLVVDRQWFWLHLDEPDWALHLRPSGQQTGSYELIVSPKLPKTELTDEDLGRIQQALAPFGLLPPADPLAPEPYIVPAKPAPPEGVRLDSVLYGLTLAPDWAAYAREKGIERSGLRVRVVIERSAPGAMPSPALELVVEAESERLIRAQALIHRLVELARDPAVGFVRPPTRPQPAAP